MKEKIDKKCLKLLNNIFWWNIRPTLGPRISGSGCDRDKQIIFCRKRVSIRSWLNRIENLKNWAHHHGTSLPCPNMGISSPGSPRCVGNILVRDWWPLPRFKENTSWLLGLTCITVRFCLVSWFIWVCHNWPTIEVWQTKVCDLDHKAAVYHTIRRCKMSMGTQWWSMYVQHTLR